MPDFILAPCVEDELWEIWAFIAKDNPEAATRVVEAAYKTFKSLAESPRLGRPRTYPHRRLKGIRTWRIVGFDNYLIFYRAISDGVQILHVYHGARDIEGMLGEAF